LNTRFRSSTIDVFTSSKSRAFRSLQIHRNKHRGANRQASLARPHPIAGPQLFNNSNTDCGITHSTPKITKVFPWPPLYATYQPSKFNRIWIIPEKSIFPRYTIWNFPQIPVWTEISYKLVCRKFHTTHI